MLDLALFQRRQLGIRSGLHVHKVVIGTGQRPDQLVQLQLGRRLLPALGVLDREHHDGGHSRAGRSERGLPGLRNPATARATPKATTSPATTTAVIGREVMRSTRCTGRLSGLEPRFVPSCGVKPPNRPAPRTLGWLVQAGKAAFRTVVEMPRGVGRGSRQQEPFVPRNEAVRTSYPGQVPGEVRPSWGRG